MNQVNNFTLVNPVNGNLGFKVAPFDDHHAFDHVQRYNYYTILLVQDAAGAVKADFSTYTFSGNVLMCFAPYQPFMIETSAAFKGIAIYFHPDFFCIHRHQKEVACNGVLFNNIYDAPFHPIQEDARENLLRLVAQMQTELQQAQLAQVEILTAYLKIFLITASRSKLESGIGMVSEQAAATPPVLVQLQDAIEANYKKERSASVYADMLHITAKNLARISKLHFNKTITDLIAERIIIEAKRELYLTSKPVKAIAYELGFDDEFYFSRFFKTKADVSPQLYRETVGFARAEA